MIGIYYFDMLHNQVKELLEILSESESVVYPEIVLESKD
jgi:hypothetical protein